MMKKDMQLVIYSFAIKKKYKSEVIGLDLSINMLEVAKQKAKKSISIKKFNREF